MSKKNPQKNKGFTLIETLVAISILSLSILGTFTAVQSGLSESIYAKDQVSAYYLAQEAMEFIENVRDNNGLANAYAVSSGGTAVYWLHGLAESPTDPCYFGKTCTIDSSTRQINTCDGGAGNCPNLNQNTTTGLYDYINGGAWVASKFDREIQLQSVNANEIIVTVSVAFDNKNIKVSQLLLNLR